MPSQLTSQSNSLVKNPFPHASQAYTTTQKKEVVSTALTSQQVSSASAAPNHPIAAASNKGLRILKSSNVIYNSSTHGDHQ